MKKNNKSDAANLRQKAEELLKKKVVLSVSDHQENTNIKLIHELDVTQIELEMQNEELLQAKEHDSEKQKLIHQLEVHKLELELQNQALSLAKEQAEIAVEKYTELYDFAPSGYATLSEVGEILEINLSGSQMLGKERSHLIHGRLGFFISDDTRDIFNLFLGKVFNSNTRETCEVTLANSGSEMTEVHLTGIASQDKEQCLVTIVDISERKRAEMELREKEVQYRNLANSGMALIWTSGTDKLCNYFNEPWLQFTGRTIEQELGNGWAEGVHPDDFDACLRTFVSSFDKREAFEMEYRLRHASGEYRWILDKGSPNYDSTGVFKGYIGNCFDITDRKHAEVEINLLNTELEKRVKQRTLQLENSNREIEAFSYSVSHDLRSPLRGIDGWSLALLEEYNHLLDEKGRIYLDRVRHEAQRMGFLIDDLLNLSRVTRAEMQHVNVNLTTLAQTIVKRLTEGRQQQQFEIIVEPDLYISGDPALLEIALTNLLDNALKFAGPRPVARVEFGETDIDGNQTFFIRDNGVGFDMEYSQKLFGAFQRLHKQSDFPGTGIGLATVQRIISRHGGHIWAESKPGEGATFYFTVS